MTRRVIAFTILAAVVLGAAWFALGRPSTQAATPPAAPEVQSGASTGAPLDGSRAAPTSPDTAIHQPPEITESGGPAPAVPAEQTGREVFLSVVYAGGSTASGARYRVKSGSWELSGTVDATVLTLGKHKPNASFTVAVSQPDLGYDAMTTASFSAEEAARTNTLLVTIAPAAMFQSGIEVDFSRFTDDLTFSVNVEVSGMAVCVGSARGGEVWRSPVLQMEYTLTVRVTGGVEWQSEELTIADGQYVRLIPEPVEFGGVTVRVTLPPDLKDAKVLLTASTAAMMRWEELLQLPHGSASEGEYAVSDAEGVVTLHGIKPGTRAFLLVGVGLEPASVEVEVLPGRLADGGSVALQRKND